MALDRRPCLICNRPKTDAIHGPPRKARQNLKEPTPRYEYHAFDAGERRQAIRRKDDQMVTDGE
jgi:hypothetical protein